MLRVGLRANEESVSSVASPVKVRLVAALAGTSPRAWSLPIPSVPEARKDPPRKLLLPLSHKVPEVTSTEPAPLTVPAKVLDWLL